MSTLEVQDRDPRGDRDARRDRDHQGRHDHMRDAGEENSKSSRSYTGDGKGSGTRDRKHHSSKKNKESTSSSKSISSNKSTSSSKTSRARPENQSHLASDTSNYTTSGVDHRRQDQHDNRFYDPANQPLTYNTVDSSGIIWGPWNRLSNGQWHREGQDPLGNWYQEDRNEDISVPRQLPPVPEDLPHEDLPDDYDHTYDNSGINWGPWSRLPNGQWHREGQDSLGNWYQEDQDEDPRSSSRMAR